MDSLRFESPHLLHNQNNLLLCHHCNTLNFPGVNCGQEDADEAEFQLGLLVLSSRAFPAGPQAHKSVLAQPAVHPQTPCFPFPNKHLIKLRQQLIICGGAFSCKASLLAQNLAINMEMPPVWWDINIIL